jgi:uncharacterized protein YigE (DUF2233 family)
MFKKMILRLTLIFLTVSLLSRVVGAPEKKVVDGVTYHVLEATPNAVKIVWKDDKGRQLRTFPDVGRYLKAKGFSVKTVMNGGIFEPRCIPSGLLIQNGKILRPVNRNNGKGNFFLKPNGIFLTSSEGAFVVATDEYPIKNIKVQQAVQSGPMLLNNGKVHPRFNANSKSRLHRNGVGILKDGRVVFAMTDFHSDKFPNLYEFAQLFRGLGCKNALFLDGDLSQMKSGEDIFKPNNDFGSTIAVVESKE